MLQTIIIKMCKQKLTENKNRQKGKKRKQARRNEEKNKYNEPKKELS